MRQGGGFRGVIQDGHPAVSLHHDSTRPINLSARRAADPKALPGGASRKALPGVRPSVGDAPEDRRKGAAPPGSAGTRRLRRAVPRPRPPSTSRGKHTAGVLRVGIHPPGRPRAGSRRGGGRPPDPPFDRPRPTPTPAPTTRRRSPRADVRRARCRHRPRPLRKAIPEREWAWPRRSNAVGGVEAAGSLERILGSCTVPSGWPGCVPPASRRRVDVPAPENRLPGMERLSPIR